MRARIAQVHGLSAHADRRGLLKWVGNLKSPPRRVFLTHGDEEQADQLAREVHSRFGWEVIVPQQGEAFELT